VIIICITIIIFTVFWRFDLCATVVPAAGNTAVSIVPLTTFPTADPTNEMRGFGVFLNGVTLTNAATSCLFNDFFPVSGPITPNGGLFNLAKDMVLSGTNLSLVNGGLFNGNSHSLSFPDKAGSFRVPGPTTIGNTELALYSDITLAGLVTFTNICTIEGNGYVLDVTGGTLAVGAGASLLMKNTILKNASGARLFCVDNLGTFSFENVTWILDASYSFTQGIIDVLYNLKLTGTQIFAYKSTKPLTIRSNSTLFFDTGMTFSYDTTANNLLAFQDATSNLHLYETTLFANNVGLQLTKGTLIIDGACSLLSNATNATQGIALGDNVSAANNITVSVLAESGFNNQSGYFVMQNV